MNPQGPRSGNYPIHHHGGYPTSQTGAFNAVQPPAQPMKKALPRWLPWAISALALLVGVTAGLFIGRATQEPEIDRLQTSLIAERNNIKVETHTETVVETLPAETIIETVTVTVEPPPPPGPAVSFGDGTYLVGTDIQPGLYKAPGGSNCYWERLSGLGGDLGSIIANSWTQGGAQVVQIASSDAAFKTEGCGKWELQG